MNDGEIFLYAEDDENDAFFMQRAFAKLNRTDTLHIVPNGRKAIDYLSGSGEYADRRKFPVPAAVILDVKMPEMSGLEALAWIRSRREFDALPVVMFTSSTHEADVEYSRRHLASAYFVKPSNADRLSTFVDRVIQATRSPRSGSMRLDIDGNVI